MDSRRRALLSIVLVATVVLAGCSASSLPGQSGADSTTTPTSLEDLSFPDGASADAIENGSDLAETHTNLLSERGYEVELTVASERDSESQTATYVVKRDAETGELTERTVQETESGERRRYTYANDTAIYEKRGTESPSYDVNRDSNASSQAANPILDAPSVLVPLGNWRDPSLVRNHGRPLIEYDLAGISADAEFIDPESVSNASGSLLVDQRGVIHRVTVNVTQTQDGTTIHQQFTYQLTAEGDVTVEKPSWVSTAAAQNDEQTQVSDRVEVVAAVGNVGGGRVETVELVVMPGAGSDDIDLSEATVQWIGPESATTLRAGDAATADSFTVEAIKDSDDSVPVLNTVDDRMRITVDASKVGSGLSAGDEAKITVTTPQGASTTYWVNVPDDLSGESAVRL